MEVISNGKQEEGTSKDPSQDKVLEIADKVCEIVKKIREDSSNVTKETNFDDCLDETKMLEIYDAIEEQFGISFNDYHLDKVVTLYDIAKLIEDPSKYRRNRKQRIMGEGLKMGEARGFQITAARRKSKKAAPAKNDAGSRSISFE
ncbi:uncharacterized protein LOC130738171 isoform X2 [Lotus japonicus]|uniref:Uncharacterized protein n=1 Tax=Lotus japonicus TaxID=34305 RepID=I3ST23_LOTJA|nr:uncharacterized protein LOC130738171 isoform X2 [Lotus japonicus]XP_057446079.1 uncharacterized protein LOC130738171 isoform X2 [Lotus japonicus]XP_057446080.1 uncharacterized protein LOC130738171 isoform X2 [Lotus japonicus]AFK43415.1 unknown [Lotus japonicus]